MVEMEQTGKAMDAQMLKDSAGHQGSGGSALNKTFVEYAQAKDLQQNPDPPTALGGRKGKR